MFQDIKEKPLKTPCLIIAFSRTQGIERLLASLDPSEISEIYVAIDGPTTLAVERTQIEIRKIFEQFSSLHGINLKIWQRTENLGVAKGIITAIDWFFSSVDYGVVLEDDLEVGENFFKFVAKNMNLLDSIDNLLMISGNQFHQELAAVHGLNWTNYPLIWGWATTRIKWGEIRAGILDSKLDLKSNYLSERINFWRVGALRVRALEVDTWDIPLANYMLSNRKLCLIPSMNLVSNRGTDEFAVHTSSNIFPLNLPLGSLDSLVVSKLPNVREIKFLNGLLEESVFKIRPRHRLIYLYYLVVNLFCRPKNFRRLSEEIAKIDIPSHN